MLIDRERLRHLLELVLKQRLRQGCALDEGVMLQRIAAASGSYDAMHRIALELRDPPKREDWPWREP